MLNTRKFISVTFIATTLIFCFIGNARSVDRVGLYNIYELKFNASESTNNPFDNYLLKVEVMDPDGKTLIIDGFFDGDGAGGQNGKIWKARINPYKIGEWSWKTLPGDNGLDKFDHKNGKFICYENDAKGGVIAEGKYFKLQNGPFIYLQGNFLDFNRGLQSTHVYMGDSISDDTRKDILRRQLDFHKANKINVYIANRGDYKGQKVTPWLNISGNVDLNKMDLQKWQLYDDCINEFEKNGLFTVIWFFADDSQYGNLSKKVKEKLFRYGMARLSSYSNTLFIICLEWEEEWSKAQINEAGNYIQAHNPWNRLISVHGLSVPDKKRYFKKKSFLERFNRLFDESNYWEFSEEKWSTFIASQVGNDSTPKEVNELAIKLNEEEAIPHLSEEFGILKSDTDKYLRAKMWANFCGGSAGGGTGSDVGSFQNFIKKSKIQFQKMKPSNYLLRGEKNNKFCLAEEGKNYVVYSEKGKINILIEKADMVAYWYNVREQSAALIPAGKVINVGQNEFETPDSENDWVLWITEKIENVVD